MQQYLQATEFIDSDSAVVQAFAARFSGINDERERAVALYYAVRDEIYYDPYSLRLNRGSLTASYLLKTKAGFCIPKAVLLAAVARASGIPARLGYADVKNHLSSPRLLETMGTDLFRYHGYTELYIDGRWVKCTPAFNKELCDKFGIKPLEFNGREDSLFHPFDTAGREHMEYILDRGHFTDLPYDEIVADYLEHYPKMAQLHISGATLSGDVAAEAGHK